MPLWKVHELTFLWFGLPGPLLKRGEEGWKGPTSRKGGHTPLEPPLVSHPICGSPSEWWPRNLGFSKLGICEGKHSQDLQPPDPLQNPKKANPGNAIVETKTWTFGAPSSDPFTLRAQRSKKNQSRLKISISLDMFNLDLQNSHKYRGLVGGSLEIFNLGRRSWKMFQSLGP